jgi:hypothetical protein
MLGAGKRIQRTQQQANSNPLTGFNFSLRFMRSFAADSFLS